MKQHTEARTTYVAANAATAVVINAPVLVHHWSGSNSHASSSIAIALTDNAQSPNVYVSTSAFGAGKTWSFDFNPPIEMPALRFTKAGLGTANITIIYEEI